MKKSTKLFAALILCGLSGGAATGYLATAQYGVRFVPVASNALPDNCTPTRPCLTAVPSPTPRPTWNYNSANFEIPSVLASSCAANQFIVRDPANGGTGWTCGNTGAGGGSVTSVATGTGLTGGPITTSGTISLDPSAVTLQSAYNGSSAVGGYKKIALDVGGDGIEIDANGGTQIWTVDTGGVTFFNDTNFQQHKIANVNRATFTDSSASVSGAATAAIRYNDSAGHLQFSESGGAYAAICPATRSVSAGTGLSGGGDLTTDRTISLANTAVTAGSYTSANITVDAQGRLTSAANGSGGVTSVSNSDGTLTISPTTGAAVASLALGHANTWSGAQTFPASSIAESVVTNLTTDLASKATDSLAAHLAGAETFTGAKTFQSGDLKFDNSGNTFATTLATSATAARTLTAPDATDTIAVLGTAQTFTANQTFNANITLGNNGSNYSLTCGSNTHCNIGSHGNEMNYMVSEHYETAGFAPSVSCATVYGGVNSTCSVSGTDHAMRVTLNTLSSDSFTAGPGDILVITYANGYNGGFYKPICQPSNDAAWNLTYGAQWRVNDANAGSNGFSIRDGGTALPTATATYQWNCVVN